MGIFSARNEAKRIWQKYVGTETKTDIEKIARDHGIKLFEEELQVGVSGILVVKNGTPFIFVNRLDAPTRRRFTIAHELGHFLLNKQDGIHIDKGFTVAFRNLRSSTGEEAQEIEANQFAAELLMPASIIEKKLDNKSPLVDENIENLANFFEVSQQAMTIRLTSLRYI